MSDLCCVDFALQKSVEGVLKHCCEVWLAFITLTGVGKGSALLFLGITEWHRGDS